MPTEKAAIAEALKSLDHTKDELWTDDGAPLVSEIQRITNDKTITRAQINDALPGFVRKSKESVAEDEQDGTDPEPEPEVAKNTTIAAPPAVVDNGEPLSEEDEYERLRLIAHQRVLDAQDGVTAAKTAISDAQRGLVAAENRLSRAMQLYSTRYPAISEAANIKQHLARQQEVLRERITGSRFERNAALNPVDAVMMNRKRDNGRNGLQPAAAPYLPRKAAVSY